MNPEAVKRMHEIDRALVELHRQESELRREAEIILLGKFIIAYPGKPAHKITAVHVSPAGHLSVEGVRVRAGKAGSRQLYIGFPIKCAALWSEDKK